MIEEMTNFHFPPRIDRSSGEARKVGVEFEFAGLTYQEAGAAVQRLFGGELQLEGSYLGKVQDTSLGDFKIEVDSRFLQEETFRSFLEEIGLELDTGEVEFLDKSLIEMFSWFVPHEIATPPIPFSKLSEIDRLEAKLSEQGGKGTQDSPFYAFGLHLNVEIIEPTVQHILSILRAFIVLSPWLRQQSRRDFSRRMTQYIDPFSKEFELLVLPFTYDPSLEQFAKDYFELAGTRNHELDLLPLLAHLGFSTSSLDDAKLISPRPTYHYRLPDCRMGEKDWSFRDEWNRWVLIEELAEDSAALQRLSEEYLYPREKPVFAALISSGHELERWLAEQSKS